MIYNKINTIKKIIVNGLTVIDFILVLGLPFLNIKLTLQEVVLNYWYVYLFVIATILIILWIKISEGKNGSTTT